MNKGLEALEIIVDRLAIKKYDESGNLTYWKSTIDKEYQVIEKELKDYENLKLKHRSMQDAVLEDFKKLKELEVLQQVLNDFKIYNTMNLIDTLKISQFLEKRHVLTAKKVRALNIIKDKDVNPVDIRCCDTVEQYNVKENGFVRLTKDEFGLLKEVLL